MPLKFGGGKYYLRVLLRSIPSDIVTVLSSAKMPAAAGILQKLAPHTAVSFSALPSLLPHHTRGCQKAYQGDAACNAQSCATTFNPARGVSGRLSESRAPVEAAVQARARRTRDKPSRLKHPPKAPAQTSSLSEGA